jgi:hypothetical protein
MQQRIKRIENVMVLTIIDRPSFQMIEGSGYEVASLGLKGFIAVSKRTKVNL